jgi:hypothetical protein
MPPLKTDPSSWNAFKAIATDIVDTMVADCWILLDIQSKQYDPHMSCPAQVLARTA